MSWDTKIEIKARKNKILWTWKTMRKIICKTYSLDRKLRATTKRNKRVATDKLNRVYIAKG